MGEGKGGGDFREFFTPSISPFSKGDLNPTIYLKISSKYVPLIGRLPAVTPAAASAAPKTAAASAAGPSAAPAAGALFLRLVDLDGLAVQGRSIQLGYGRFGILILGESYESKAPGAPRIPVGDDLGFGNFPMGGEGLFQTVVRRVPAQPPYE